jgi:hypothetical protein
MDLKYIQTQYLRAYQACAAKWKVPEFRDIATFPTIRRILSIKHSAIVRGNLGCLSGITVVLVTVSTG